MPTKTPIDQIEKHISDFGYKTTLSDFSKINNNTKIPFICEEHGEFFMTLKAIKKGYKCRKCSAKKRALRNSAFLFEKLLASLKEKYGDKIRYVSGYQNKSTKCTFECKEHGLFDTTFEIILNAKKDGGCPKCAIKLRGKKRTTIEEIKKIVDSDIYTVLSKEYARHKQKIEIFCNKHKTSSFLTLDKIKKGKRCKYCSYKQSGKARRIPVEEAKNQAKSFGYELLGDYQTALSKTEFLCSRHGPFISNLNDIKGGHGCPECANRKSQPNEDLFKFVCDLGLNCTKNDKSAIRNSLTNRPLEIDILIKDKNIGIEYCGLYWHNENSPFPRDRNSHKLKHDLCKSQGIQLITIFEDEWLERRPQIENILKAKLGLLPRIYARNTEIVELKKEEAKLFLENNHLQGSCSFMYAFGLVYEGEIVGCATLSKHHRQNRKEAVLSRLCFSNYAVVGGSSKLFKAIKQKAKELGFKSLVSWSDNRWSDGGVYKELGMVSRELPPDYSYVKEGCPKRISKQSCKKKNLIKKGAVGDTELEMAKSLGYSRIWDCGKIRWSINL
jgi:hypothetical protein